MKRYEIAKLAYQEILDAISKIQEEYQIFCDTPSFIEVDGEIFSFLTNENISSKQIYSSCCW